MFRSLTSLFDQADRRLAVPVACLATALLAAGPGAVRASARPATPTGIAAAATLAGGGCSGDTDCDGISDDDEQAAPNEGDGDHNDVQDYLEATTASYPIPDGPDTAPGYITLVVNDTCAKGFENVTPSTEQQMGSQDPDYDYPYGLASFLVRCENAQVKFIVDFSFDDGDLKHHKKRHGHLGVVKRHHRGKGKDLLDEAYRKYAPNPVPEGSGPVGPGAEPGWFTLENATADFTDWGDDVWSFTLKDGDLGDSEAGDGMIVDPGGVGFVPGAPALPHFAVFGLALALAAAGVVRLRRGSVAG